MIIEAFRNQELAYLTWLSNHPNGFVLNTKLKPSPNYFVLHRSTCKFITDYLGNSSAGAFTERNYQKICSDSDLRLSLWAHGNGANAEPTSCSRCNPKGKLKIVDQLDQYHQQFDKDIEESSKDRVNRLIRLAIASKNPSKRALTTTVFDRNPDVVAEVLYRAQGTCERCGREAPFVRAKDNKPYLEVHHKTLLSQGGEDSVDNAQAQCPNCHREVHFGTPMGNG